MHTEKRHAVFSENQIEVLIERDERSSFSIWEQFALDHLLCKFDQGVEDAKIPLLHRDLEGLHVEPIAASTHLEFPHCVFAAGRPRRVLPHQ